MSTVRSNISQRRFAILAQMSEKVFHVDDLANLWQIRDKNTLHTTLKRYAQRGLIFRIYRGLYCIDKPTKIDQDLLGCRALHGYCYVSTESVLERAGIIIQKTNYVTLISSQSKRFNIAGNGYYCRQLTDRFLFNPAGIYEKNKIQYATAERAVADLLYFNPDYYFDAKDMIDWDEVREMQKEIGYKT